MKRGEKKRIEKKRKEKRREEKGREWKIGHKRTKEEKNIRDDDEAAKLVFIHFSW